MKKNLKVLFLLFAASVLIMACGLAGPDAGDAPAPADVAESVAEEEADAPAEEAAEPTPVPEMDLSDLILTPEDFPDVAFSQVSLEEMGMSVDDLNSEDFTVESFFALLEPTNFEMVMGFTTQLNSLLQRTGFDLTLNQPETLLEAFLGGMGDMGASDMQELPEFEDTIGDSSAGMSVVADMEGMGMRMDVVVFRRGSVGSFVITMYLDGQEPPVSLMDVATKFDAKIESFLASQ